ncbi:rano class II histocompatibility antigen, A beta chain-like [Plectropomus leopardus]|uniref:rano class II histocompatibility antigen, A beta chain-like n=1 Tax=Plectropomus leopardus TaxID=160734 RepID=UPI001C4ADBC3|nr:rano class II histocompatibility antigen, A beta chain-like [Plectropomus leopardus]
MHILNFLLGVFFSPLSLVFSEEVFLQYSACCVFKGPDLDHVEYDIVNRVNNKVLIRFNSTRGNWTGNTPFAIEMAKVLNTNPVYAIRRAFEMKVLCIDNIGLVKQIGSLTSAPIIKMNSVNHPPMLVCSAYNFYPKHIRMTWLRNGQEVTSAASFSEAMPDGDWYYQIHSYLVHTPTAGEKITCMVEHLSLSEPILQVWDHSLSASERINIVFGTLLLALGFVLMSTGFIYYKKKSGVTLSQVTLCQGRVLVPMEDPPAAEATC